MSRPITSINKFLVILAGPTGIGKSSIAIHLAKTYNAEIFSADSRQIYKEMNVGTAKPTRSELDDTGHHFIGEISIFEKYSVGHYETDLNLRLESYFKSNDIAIMAGGTGLYLRAIMEGLDEFPEVPTKITDELNNSFVLSGLEYLRDTLQQLDPEYYASMDNFNHRRLIRALSVIKASGKTYSSFLLQKKSKEKNYIVIPILLEMSREELYERINLRVEEMISCDLEAEAKLLHQFRGIQALETVGYQELFDYFEGKYDLRMAVDLIKQNSRRYAKRQMTWFRKYGEWKRFHPQHILEIQNFIDKTISTNLKI